MKPKLKRERMGEGKKQRERERENGRGIGRIQLKSKPIKSTLTLLFRNKKCQKVDANVEEERKE